MKKTQPIWSPAMVMDIPELPPLQQDWKLPPDLGLYQIEWAALTSLQTKHFDGFIEWVEDFVLPQFRCTTLNAQHFESNTSLCKVITKDSTHIVRCCVKSLFWRLMRD